jgi:two-component system response regulator RegX3
MMKILLIEDDAQIADLVVSAFEALGIETQHEKDGFRGLRSALQLNFDAILLDVALPLMDGFQVLEEIRRNSLNTPVIMLTARTEEIDRVMGLEMGADDYVTKPYSSRELLARVKAVLRRGGGEAETETEGVLEIGPVRMDIERHVVTVNTKSVRLPLKEFDLLEILMRNAGRVLTRGQLIDRVWGSDYVGDTKTLDVHVKRLRAKIEEDPSMPQYIVTVRGLGYKFDL